MNDENVFCEWVLTEINYYIYMFILWWQDSHYLIKEIEKDPSHTFVNKLSRFLQGDMYMFELMFFWI